MDAGAQAATWQIIAAAIVFLLTYALIITEKINRAVLAMAGAVAMIALGVVGLKQAYTIYMEWETIFLLVGMMILVGIANKTGMFQFAAVKAAQLAKGDPVKILVALSALTGIASAFLDNVTTVLLIVPVTFEITRILRVNPLPYLIAQIMASNIGGTATLIGDPPNIMIGSKTHLSFNDFILNLGPVVAVILAVTLLIIKVIYAKGLKVDEERKAALMKLDAAGYIGDRRLLVKSLVVLGLTIAGFALHSVIHIEAAVIAVAGATLLMLFGVKDKDVEKVFHEIEWVTIFFFLGLFVLVGGLIEVGIMEFLASQTLDITKGSLFQTSMLILWVSGIASATVDNIPFVATMIPLIQDLSVKMNVADPETLNPVWWSLALGACLGGNGTIIGASANVIVAGMAAREGKPLTYMSFLKIGAPLTLLALAISAIYIALVYF